MGVGIYLNAHVDRRGRRVLRMKCRTKGQSFTKSLGISVRPEDWDDKAYRVRNAIPAVAKKLAAIRENMYRSWELYEAGAYTFEELTRRLTSSEAGTDVMEFVKTVFSANRTSSTTQSYIAVVRTYRTTLGIDILTFNHINYSNITEAINKWKQKGLSPVSIRTYLNHLGAILNEAHRRGLVDEPFKSHPSYRQKTPTTIVRTATPALFREAIDKIQDLRDFQALCMWLLQFTMRGFYTSDLSTMHLHNRQNESDVEASRYVLHKRSKTGEPMNILYSCKPTEGLILALQNSIHITHKNNPNILPDRTNPLQLFQYDYSDNRVHKNVYSNYALRCSKLLLPYKTARKTFESVALSLDTSAEVRYKLLGHVDATIKKHYIDWEWSKLSDKIDAAHLEILNAFEAEALFNELLDKVTSTKTSTKDFLLSTHIENDSAHI